MSSYVVRLGLGEGAEGGTVDLDVEGIEIGYAGGAYSPEWLLICTSAVFEDLLALVGVPITLRITATTHSGNTDIEFNPFFDHLYIWDMRYVSKHEFYLTLRDHRSTWEQIAFFGEFNVPRITNEQVLPGYAIGAQIDWDRIAQYRYLPRSGMLEKSEPPQRSQPTATSGIWAWTAYRALRYVLEVWLPEYDRLHYTEYAPESVTFDDDVRDNGHILHDEVFEGDSLPVVLNRLLDLCRLSLFPKGRDVIVYRTDYDVKYANVGRYDGSRELARNNYSGARAGRIRRLFPKLHELRLNGDEDAGGEPSRTRSELYCENVFRNPSRVVSPAGTYEAEEWLTITEGLAAYNADGTHPWAHGKALTIGDLRALVRRPEYIEDYAFSDQYEDGVDPILLSRLRTLVTSYRRIWRICSTWLDVIEFWQPLRVAQIDATTRKRAVSPVWADCTFIPTLSAAGEGAKSAWITRAWAAGDATRRLDTANVSGYLFLRTISHDLGIFEILVAQDRRAQVEDVVLGVPENLPDLDIFTAARAGGVRYYRNMTLSSEFHFSTLITARLATPVGSENRFVVDERSAQNYLVQGVDAAGPDIYVVDTTEPARIEWDDSTSRIVDDPIGGMRIEGGDLVNKGILDAIGDAEARRYYFSVRDRLIGTARTPYWDEEVCRPRGSVSSVVVMLEPGGVLETEFRAPLPPEPADRYDYLPPRVKRYLYPRLEFNGRGAT